MPERDFTRFQRKRLNPYKGLVIDVPTWTDAHDYHRDKQRLHALSLHRHGIVTGLDVVAWNPPDNSVVIHPGIALDPEGDTIVVPEQQRFQVNTGDKGTARILLRYSEVDQDMTELPGEGKALPLRTLEAFRIEERRQAPEESDLELARIVIEGKAPVIKDAADPLAPASNEIDTRYRSVSGPRSRGCVTLAVLDTPGWERHQDGILNLVRAINQSTDYRASFVGPVGLGGEFRDCDLLFISGSEEFQFGEDQEKVLSEFLDRGGVLMGEACLEGGQGTKEQAKAFRQAFGGLAQRLGRKLRSVERGHPLLKVYHLFAGTPSGIDGPALMVEDQGMLYSDGDFGCVWAGGTVDKAVSRDTIRDALELGTNIALYAYQRTRSYALRSVAE